MHPIYQITSAGADVSAALADRLISITVEDNISDACDRVSITLFNPEREMVPPGWGKRIGVALGYKETGLVHLGEWEVSQVDHAEPERVITIEATGQALPQLLGSRQVSRDGITIGELASEIAGRHGLDVNVDDELAGIYWPHLDQNESDAHLLSRVLTQYDGRWTVTPQRVLVIAGQSRIPAAPVRALPVGKALKSLSITSQVERTIGTVQAHWHDLGAAEYLSCSDGDGDPNRDLGEFPTEDQARAAVAEASRRRRVTGRKLNTVLLGDGGWVSGMKAGVAGYAPWMDGEYFLNSVKHRFDKKNGYVTTLEGQAELNE